MWCCLWLVPPGWVAGLPSSRAPAPRTTAGTEPASECACLPACAPPPHPPTATPTPQHPTSIRLCTVPCSTSCIAHAGCRPPNGGVGGGGCLEACRGLCWAGGLGPSRPKCAVLQPFGCGVLHSHLHVVCEGACVRVDVAPGGTIEPQPLPCCGGARKEGAPACSQPTAQRRCGLQAALGGTARHPTVPLYRPPVRLYRLCCCRLQVLHGQRPAERPRQRRPLLRRLQAAGNSHLLSLPAAGAKGVGGQRLVVSGG